MNKYIITGASGLIGSYLIGKIRRNNSIVAISRAKEKRRDKYGDIEYKQFDLSSPLKVESLPQKCDVIIHLAQSEYFREFPQRANNIFHVNTVSTLNLLDYARKAGVKTFVYASSGGVGGYSNKGFTEDAPINSRNDIGFYLSSKLCSEIILESYTSYFNIIVLRFFFVYGPGQKQNMLIPRLVNSVIDGSSITLKGEDGIRINPIYIDDAVDSIIKSIKLNTSQKINVAGPDSLSLREIVTIISKELNKDPVFKVIKEEKPENLIGDTSKMKLLLGSPKYKFQYGLKKYIESLNYSIPLL